MAAVQRFRGLFIFTVFSSFITVAISILNLDELKNSKYGIEITSVPVMLQENSHVSNSMLLSSKHGQQYQCMLPQLGTEEAVKDIKTNFTTEEITDLLKPMQNQCLYLNKGWWMYEFCYGRSVSQYHEEGNLVVGEKISLGVYSSQTDWSKEKIELPYSKNSSKRFHSQFFENGTKCDLNGELRSTQVKFKCEVGGKDHITMVDEPSSCTYVMIIHTEKLCKHLLFKLPADRKPLPITCSPALSQEHYQTYLTTIELEKKAKAKALADKIRKMQQDEDDDIFDDLMGGNEKRKPRRSELWPWNNPGVENNDETWINGNIEKASIGISRMDIIRGRKIVNDEEPDAKDTEERTITIMSRGMNHNRKLDQNTPESVEGGMGDKQKTNAEKKQQDNSVLRRKELSKEKNENELLGRDTNEGKEVEESHSDNEAIDKDIKRGKEVEESHTDNELMGKDAKEGKQVKESHTDNELMDKDAKEGKQVKESHTDNESMDKDAKEAKQVEESYTDNPKRGENGIKLGVFTPTSSSKIVGKVSEERGKTSVDEEHKLQDESSKTQTNDKEQKKKKSLEEEWKEALTKARDHFKSVVRKELKGMGVDPNELEEKVKFMRGFESPKEHIVDKKTSQLKGEKKLENQEEKNKILLDPTIDGLKAAVDKKLETLMDTVRQKEEQGKLETNSMARRVLTNIKKIMQGMDHQNVLLMKKEETLQRELEKHFGELQHRFDMEATMMKRFIDDIEERGIDVAEGEEEDDLKNIVEKLKVSVHRFDVSNKALSKDMEAVKDLNREVHSKIDNLVGEEDANRKNKGSDFFRLAAKANLLLRRLLKRSAQLDKDMKAMKEISKDIKARKEEYFDDFSGEKEADVKENSKLKKEAELRLGSIVQKLKKMFKSVNKGDFETAGQSDILDSEDPIETQEMEAKRGPSFDNIKVRVTKIKGDGGKTEWSEDEEEKEMGKDKTVKEMNIEERLKRASKRMEKLVKKQLKSAGVSLGGKVRVKIITSRDALENFSGGKGMEILSDEETNQFKEMIMTLMGGSTEAGTERKKQAELENNYSLVWGKNKLKTAPTEEEEPEAELVFDDTKGL